MARGYPVEPGANVGTGEAADRLGESKIWQVIGSSSVGTVIEWYDFYIFGSLAALITANFYPPGDATRATLGALATFGAGFAARPFGALVFGRIGDLVGRKYAFLVTLLIMGGATFIIGLLPGFGTIGYAAPVILIILRVVQGLALGGEYGGAAVYVAEHVPDNRRGFYTSFIQTTATLGLFVSLLVILFVREVVYRGNLAGWNSFGWRIPFLVSIFLVLVSLFIRLRLRESPLFQHMKTAGTTSKAPITDSFGSANKWQTILTVLWGAAAGQAVVWYTGQFYALFWLQTGNLGNVPFVDSNIIIAAALLCATPFFIVFGALSDRIGRKSIMMAGNLLGAVLTIPIFALMWQYVPRANNTNSANYNPFILGVCVFVLVIFVTMVYGPIAAFLVESFPAKVRYTSVSLPYHIGNGYFGGFLPTIAAAIVLGARGSGNWVQYAQYAGLIYTVVIALITFVLGTFLIRETKDNTIDAVQSEPVEKYPGQPAILALLVALSVIALILADQFVLVRLNTPTFSVQWAFRIMLLLVVGISVLFALSRRGRSAAVSETGGTAAD